MYIYTYISTHLPVSCFYIMEKANFIFQNVFVHLTFIYELSIISCFECVCKVILYLWTLCLDSISVTWDFDSSLLQTLVYTDMFQFYCFSIVHSNLSFDVNIHYLTFQSLLHPLGQKASFFPLGLSLAFTLVSGLCDFPLHLLTTAIPTAAPSWNYVFCYLIHTDFPLGHLWNWRIVMQPASLNVNYMHA